MFHSPMEEERSAALRVALLPWKSAGFSAFTRGDGMLPLAAGAMHT